MFILITGECEVIGCETTVQVFATHKQAHDAMVKDANQRAWDAGVAVGDDMNLYIDYVGENEGYIVDVVGWQIREVPGAFIPADAAEGLHECIREAAEIFGDEFRFDYYDADDLCQNVCWELEEYL